jgi:hypothetical protein
VQVEGGGHQLGQLADRVAASGVDAGKVDHPHPVARRGDEQARRLDGQPGLPDTARAGERHEPGRPEHGAQIRDVAITTDDLVPRRGQVRPRRCAARGRVQRGFLGQDRPVQLDEFGRGIEAELVAEPDAQLVVALQRLGLPAGPVQRA